FVLLLQAARFAANKIAVRAKFDLFVLDAVVVVVIATAAAAGGDTDGLLIPIDSLFASLSDK
ncbi:unnamed protein product, partial [Rotaria magnacalcarata]